MRKMIASLLIFNLVFCTATVAFAQESKAPKTREEMVARGLRRQLRTILLGGLAGGVLGMSVLSFEGQPQKKLTYIPMGIGLGLITGVVVSTSQLVNNPQDLMDGAGMTPDRERFSVSNGDEVGFTWAVNF